MNYEKYINNFINKHGMITFSDSIKLALYQTGNAPYMTNESELSDLERKVVEWLERNLENKLKDFFLADLSWAENQQERDLAFINFFTKRMGKRVLEILPEDIKNYVLANVL